jgi:ribosomal protein S18 acetylase RimI-like enzyme
VCRHDIIENYRESDLYREKYFRFVERVFDGVGFREWYARGFWDERYIPYSIILDDLIISNVSVSKMKLIVQGKAVNGIQIGAVGTLKEYRGKGYSRMLMEYVIRKYGESTDLVFLFANNSVVEFYPKFGFRRYQERVFIRDMRIDELNYMGKKLSFDSKADYQIIDNVIRKRRPLTRLFGALDYGFVTAWHILNVYRNDLVYLSEEDVIFILTVEGNRLHVWDVIFSNVFDFNEALKKVISDTKITQIVLYFPPDVLNFDYTNSIIYKDSPLFVMGDLPIEKETFKFPITAQT